MPRQTSQTSVKTQMMSLRRSSPPFSPEFELVLGGAAVRAARGGEPGLGAGWAGAAEVHICVWGFWRITTPLSPCYEQARHILVLTPAPALAPTLAPKSGTVILQWWSPHTTVLSFQQTPYQRMDPPTGGYPREQGPPWTEKAKKGATMATTAP